MKQKIYYIGLVAAIIMSTGAIFKLEHWPAAAHLMILGTAILVLLFLPAALINHYKSEGDKQSMLLHIVIYITCLVVFTAMLYKIMHWPGAGYGLLIALPFPYVVFLPVFLVVTSKNKSFNIYNTVSVLLLLALNSVFSALLSLNVSKDTITDSYGFSKSLSRSEAAISELPSVSGMSPVNGKIDEILKITADYQDIILKSEGLTREQWKKDPGNLIRPDDVNTAAVILSRTGEKPAGLKLEKAMNELISLMQQTKGYEETAKALPSVLGLGASNGDDEAWSFAYRNILVPLSWSLIYLDGVETNLMMIKVTGPAVN